MTNAINWIKDNYMVILDCFIGIATIVVPIVVSKLSNDKIATRKNMFRGYIVFMIKVVFYYFILVCVFWGAGSILHIPNSVEWMNKKTYLMCCIGVSGVCSLIAGLRWRKCLDIQKKNSSYSRILTIILIVFPVLLQGILYMVAVVKAVPSLYWTGIWIGLTFPVILMAASIVADDEFFEYQYVVLSFGDDTEDCTIEPGSLHSKDKWIIVDDTVNNIRTKFSAEHVQKITYYGEGECTHEKRMKQEVKIGYILICLFYLLTIGVVSQSLFNSVIKRIAVTDSIIYLQQGDCYQLGAVTLDFDAGKLRYDVSDPSVINISENGIVTVNAELSEGKQITTEVTISDEIGNTAQIKIEVRG